MKNRRNLITVLVFVVALALSVAAAKVGHHGSYYGFSSGG
jgi:hypothetical protein